MNRPDAIPPLSALFNVAVNGVDVAIGLPLVEARAVMAAHTGFRQLYRADKPLAGRRSPWRKFPTMRPVTRWPALSAAELAKSYARITAREWAANGMAGECIMELDTADAEQEAA